MMVIMNKSLGLQGIFIIPVLRQAIQYQESRGTALMEAVP
jgi:hypothetical protein